MRGLLRDATRYLFFNYVAIALNTLRGIVLIGILDPASLGIYRMIFTYSSYFRYYNLGLNALAFYRAPLKKMHDVYADLIYKINVFLSLVFGLLFSGIFAYAWSGGFVQVSGLFVFLLLFVILVFTQLNETYVTIGKIRDRFSTINKYNVLLALSSFILMVALGMLFQLKGVIIGLAIATFLCSVFWYLTYPRQRPAAHLKLSKWKVFTLFKFGTITILPGILTVLFSTVEVWIISFKYGVAETGYYSVVMTLINLILMLNSDGLVVLYRRKAINVKQDRSFILKISVISSIFLAAICTASVYVVDLVTNLWFKEYQDSARIFDLCFWGIPFLAFKNISLYYISNNKTLRLTIVLGFLLVLKIVVLLSTAEPSAFYTMIAVINAVFGLTLIAYLLLTPTPLTRQSRVRDHANFRK